MKGEKKRNTPKNAGGGIRPPLHQKRGLHKVAEKQEKASPEGIILRKKAHRRSCGQGGEKKRKEKKGRKKA